MIEIITESLGTMTKKLGKKTQSRLYVETGFYKAERKLEFEPHRKLISAAAPLPPRCTLFFAVVDKRSQRVVIRSSLIWEDYLSYQKRFFIVRIGSFVQRIKNNEVYGKPKKASKWTSYYGDHVSITTSIPIPLVIYVISSMIINHYSILISKLFINDVFIEVHRK